MLYKVPVCPQCGSINVVRDAYARFNPETQMWEVVHIFDDSRCDDCEYEGGTVDWKHMTPQKYNELNQ